MKDFQAQGLPLELELPPDCFQTVSTPHQLKKEKEKKVLWLKSLGKGVAKDFGYLH